MRSHTVTLHCEHCNTAHVGHGPTREDAKLSAKRGLKECRRRHRLDDRRDAFLDRWEADFEQWFAPPDPKFTTPISKRIAVASYWVQPYGALTHQNTPQGGDK